jgi:type IV pilus assembly protein PilM
MFSGHKKLLVGIDIGTHSIKLVKLKARGKSYQLLNFGIMPLRPETIVDNAIIDEGSIVEAVRNLVRMEKIKSKDVATAISGQSVIVKRIRVPRMTPKELNESIQWEAEQHIPFEISDVNIDFQVLPPFEGEEDRGAATSNQMDVLLVAAKKTKIQDYETLLSSAGLNPMVMDIDIFALENEFETTHGREQAIIALVDIGASTMNINILKHGLTMFQRDIAIGGNRYTASIQKKFSVNYDQAEALKMGVGFTDSINQAHILPSLASVSEEIGEEIQRSFEFFRTTTSDEVIDKMVISGGCAKIRGLDRFLSHRLGVPVAVADPFRGIYYNEKLFDPEYLRDMAPVATVSMGLALRRVNDR